MQKRLQRKLWRTLKAAREVLLGSTNGSQMKVMVILSLHYEAGSRLGKS